MLTNDREALPRFAASAALMLMPSQDATSGSASKMTVFVASVLMVFSWPPLTKIPVPCEKIWTGPWLPSITSLMPAGTCTSSGALVVVRQFGLLGSFVGRLGSLCGRMYGLPLVVPYGLLVAVQVAVSVLP